MQTAAQLPPDGALVEQTRRGDPEAFGELVRRYQGAVFNVCYRMMGERAAAEDMAQEAFIRAYERLHTLDASRPFGPWMRRVAANLCLNQLARPGAPAEALEDEAARPAGEAPPGSQDPARLAERAQMRRDLRAAIAGLPPRYRAAIELRHFQDLSYVEMASALKRPLSDVKSDLFRARKLLAQILKADEAHAE